MKLRHGVGKYIVKKAIEGLVPHEIIYRKKMGFPTPLRQWLRDPRAGNLFQIMRAKDGLLASYIDPAALEIHACALEELAQAVRKVSRRRRLLALLRRLRLPTPLAALPGAPARH